MIETVLIANRGEIAARIARTCHAQGLSTVAVFSDADADLPFVRLADRAVRIGPPKAAESYLHVERILEAAERTGADAVHPGYGFLAENAAFARAVRDAGLVWIGPSPEAIAAMGDKTRARRLAREHEVPTVPGYDGEAQDAAALAEQAATIGYPVLIKAAAGGGGRGMRRVDEPEAFADALASAKREAKSAFGDGTVLLEKYVVRPRHIEIQIMGDTRGNVIHLGERECSIQRRHQKILEEAPSPAVDPDLRRAMGAAAVRIAEAVDYVGAGTVEFILDPDGHFYFLEMNTRLQVEHPVTELVTGLDLVALQLRVADGHPLGIAQGDVSLEGHAIEARLYAEDAQRDHLPQSGPLVRFDLPGGEGVRIDAGYETGGEVGVHYDPMLAKLIAWGPDRATANRRLGRVVRRAWVPGVITNLPLLRQVVAHDAWKAGDLDTHFLDRHELPQPPPLNLERGAVAATTTAWWRRQQDRPWPASSGFRIEGGATSEDRWLCGAEEVRSTWRTLGDDTLEVGVRLGQAEQADQDVEGHPDDATVHTVRVIAERGDAITAEIDGVVTTWRTAVRKGHRGDPDRIEDDDVVYTHFFGDGESMLQLVPRFPPPAAADAPAGSCVAPTPGTVTALHVAVGDAVGEGDQLATLEAMKMEHVLTAPEAGTVEAILAEVGESVEQGAVVLRLDTDGE